MIRDKEELLELVRKHGTNVMNDDELTYYIFEDPDPEINRIIDKEFEKIDAMLERITWKDKFRLWLHFLFHGKRLEKRIWKSIEEQNKVN